jgi:histidine ammonia-lyase
LSLVQEETIGDHYSVICGVPQVVDLTNEIFEQSSMKRKEEANAVAKEPAKKP